MRAWKRHAGWSGTFPSNAKILVEPSQNTPPMGSYFTKTDFYRDYVHWGGRNRA